MEPISNSPEELAASLVRRGMQSSQGLVGTALQTEIAERLRFISFHRLSPYWAVADPMGIAGNAVESRFRPGTYWESVMARYMFDRKLRLAVFDAISRIEIALRTQIAYWWVHETGNDFPQKDHNNYQPAFRVSELFDDVNRCFRSSQTSETLFYKNNCRITDARDLPIRAFVEYTSFGNIRKLLTSGFKTTSLVPGMVACNMGMPGDLPFFLSVVSVLNDVRNACAHQSRVWNNRWLGRRGDEILKRSTNPLWNYTWDAGSRTWCEHGGGDKLVLSLSSSAAVLTACQIIIKTIALRSQWSSRILNLIAEHTPHKHAYRAMGFTNPYWPQHPFWQR